MDELGPADAAEAARASAEAERWAKIKALFNEALDRPTVARHAFVSAACADDLSVRDEVLALLASDSAAAEFAELPAAELLAWAGPTDESERHRLEPGTRLGAYEVIGFLSAGGMGEVYRARHTVLERDVALKTLSAALTDPLAKRRLVREAQHASKLRHPNICTIFEVGEADGTPFFAMELVDGIPLSAMIRTALPDLDAGTAHGIQVADALEHAHQHGILHCDLKSSNIVVDRDGRPILLDFGLARQVIHATGRPPSVSGRTGEGPLVGTVAYMAPEVLRGEAADTRSDIWSLGVLLHELMTGELPFDRDTPVETISAILTESRRPLASRGVPAAVRRVIDGCLVSDPDARYQHAHEVRDALVAARRPSTWPLVRPPLHPPRRRRRQHVALALAAIGMLSIGAVTWHLTRSAPPPASSPAIVPDRVAVFPFAVSGSREVEYLREGMVNLLAGALDGAGQLRTVDARTMLVSMRRAQVDQIDPPTARQLAAQLGASLYVLGEVVEANRQMRITASLHHMRDGGPPVHVTVEADTGQLFPLVDGLVARLVAGHSRRPTERVTRVAAMTTSSIPALKAYLEGEAEVRHGRWDRAVAAFERATSLDPTFALAWYRLSLAAEWFSRGDLQREAAEQAVRHMDRLSEHDRRLLEALLAWRRGAAAEAEHLYQVAVGDYPDDVEAWTQLAEVQFHYGPLLGRPIGSSRVAWERVLALDPDHGSALFHLARLAARDGRWHDLELLVHRILQIQPEAERTLEMRAFRAIGIGAANEQRDVAAELREATDNTLAITVRSLLTYVGPPPSSDRLTMLLTEPRRSPEVRALGHLLMAHVVAGRGEWRLAWRHLDQLKPLAPAWALAYRALLSLAPQAQVSTQDLAEIREALLGWDAHAVRPMRTPGLYVLAHDRVHPHTRRYLLGMVHARLGAVAAAEEMAAVLERVKGEHAELARSFAHRIRAEIHRQAGALERALQEIEEARFDVMYDYTNNSPFYSQPYERFRRAEILEELGRADEALLWYGSLRELSPYEFVYVGPALIRQAGIYSARGDAQRASEARRELAALWREADLELQAMTPATSR